MSSDQLAKAIDLAAACNLRDLGGLPAAGGQIVRPGLLFRSASLHRLDPAEAAALRALGLQLVIDLRSADERAHQPGMLEVPTWSRDYGHSSADLRRSWQRPDLAVADVHGMMIDIYRGLAEEQADAYAVLFGRIAAGALPLLFHCTAGKDRTGVGAALLLDLLGVPRAVILQDYLRTRATLSRSLAGVRASLRNMGVPELDDALLAPLLGVEPEYLEEMFATITRHYGSVEGYVTQRLGIGVADCGAIRRNLLGPAG